MIKTLSAYDKALDYLSRRDHSTSELKTKLLQKGYELTEIHDALLELEERSFLQKPEVLSERIANMLHNKLKGILYIQKYLKGKNLPSIIPNWELELEKAQKLLDKSLVRKYKEDRQKIYRYLQNRGFTEQTIRKVIHEEF